MPPRRTDDASKNFRSGYTFHASDSDSDTPLPKPPKPLYNLWLCGRRIMAITLASQARDVGSIPIARSTRDRRGFSPWRIV